RSRPARRSSSPLPTSAVSHTSAPARLCRCITSSSCSRRDSRVAEQWGERRPRSVSFAQIVALSVGITIGSGIFRVPATVAAQLQFPGPMLLCWVLGGIIALCGALTVAELAAALPRSGGIFAYLLEGYGPLPAFL